jgi:hypothetical protein
LKINKIALEIVFYTDIKFYVYNVYYTHNVENVDLANTVVQFKFG